MNTQSIKKTWWNDVGNIILPILLALAFLLFTFSYYPFREKLQYDTDEGLNLMRSMLVELGHPLYSEVSSDQPPLFNQILALVFRVTGFEVNAARMLVLLFSTLLVWAGAQFLQLTSGKLAGILFLPIVILLPRYLDLSVSVMIGLPSIALAAVSMLFVTVWHLKRANVWLVLSGFALALSVLIKLFTGFVAPILVIGIVISEYLARRHQDRSWKMLRPALIWSTSFVGLGVLLGLILIGPQNLWLIIFPPLAAPSQELFQGENFSLNSHLEAAVPLLVLGAFGVLVTIYRRQWLMLYPLAWAGLAYGLFSFYSPVFYHHQLLITIPMAMIAAAAVGDGISSLIHIRQSSDILRFQTVLGVIALAGMVWVYTSYAPVVDKELMNHPRLTGFNLKATPGKLKVLRTMGEYADQTHWIVTDTPMYAFRVQRPVPPILATFSSKRLATGSLAVDDILGAMDEYQPEQVMMARFEIPALEQYLHEHYTLILSAEFYRLFLRNDLISAPQ